MVERSARTGREKKKKKLKRRESGTDGGGEGGKSKRGKRERGSRLDLFLTIESKQNKQKKLLSAYLFISEYNKKQLTAFICLWPGGTGAAEFCLSPHSSVLQSGREEH